MTMERSMRVNGATTKNKVKDMKYLQAKISILDSIAKENLMDWESISGITAKSTKESGKKASDMAQELGKELITQVMSENGDKENLKDLVS